MRTQTKFREKPYANNTFSQKLNPQHYAHNSFFGKVVWKVIFIKSDFGHLFHVHFSKKYF
jgi:hypothetical protein